MYKTLLAILHDDMSSNDNNRKSCGWVMELVVDLLQSVLDLLTDHWINISVISQFYSNVFYFLDHSLLNSLMEMIKEQDFVTTQSGPVIRVHLNMLEGWACGIGLKEEVLENLARLSAAADLLASQEAELVQVSTMYSGTIYKLDNGLDIFKYTLCIYLVLHFYSDID